MISLRDYILLREEESSDMILEMGIPRNKLIESLKNRAEDVAEHIILILSAKFQNPNCEELYNYWIKELQEVHINPNAEKHFKFSSKHESRLTAINEAYNKAKVETFAKYKNIIPKAYKRERKEHLKRAAKGIKSYLVTITPDNEIFNLYLKIITLVKDLFAKAEEIVLNDFKNLINSILNEN